MLTNYNSGGRDVAYEARSQTSNTEGGRMLNIDLDLSLANLVSSEELPHDQVEASDAIKRDIFQALVRDVIPKIAADGGFQIPAQRTQTQDEPAIKYDTKTSLDRLNKDGVIDSHVVDHQKSSLFRSFALERAASSVNHLSRVGRVGLVG